MPTLTAQEALELQRASNQKHIERADESYMDLGQIRIFNVGPIPHVISLGGLGLFTVPACPKGRSYSVPLKIWKMTPEGQNVDMNKIAERLINGWGIAEAIVGYGQQMHASTDMRKMGIFTCGAWVTVQTKDGVRGKILASLEKPYLKQNDGAKIINVREVTKAAIQAARKNGDERDEAEIATDILAAYLPTEAEINEANKLLGEYCTKLVHEANDYFRNNHLDEIQPIHRWAGEFTGQFELPWMKTSLIMGKCAVCGNQLLPDVAICLGCDTIQPGKEAQIIAARVPKYAYLWDPSHPAFKHPEGEQPKGKGKQQN